MSSSLKTYMRFPTQLQSEADWLMYQAEAVHAKTVCWVVVLKLCLSQCYISPFTFFSFFVGACQWEN